MHSTTAKPTSWTPITDYHFPKGWDHPAQRDTRARDCCRELEEGKILFFEHLPYDFPADDREFLLSQKQSSSRVHKNISYRPHQDKLRGSAGGADQDLERLHRIMRHFSTELTRLLSAVLAPYAKHWALDYASFRPEQEQGRDLPLHKRNDLLHVDSFPTRPTRGGRILRCFTNINPIEPRVWFITDPMPVLAQEFAMQAGLEQFARRSEWDATNMLQKLKKAVGIKAVEYSNYDKFMLHFHDYLKENTDFQQNYPKTKIDFPPMSTWMCFTDSVPHAVLSGQYALEQTFIIPVQAMVKPEIAPIAVLEKIAGRPLARRSAASPSPT